jgi:hypothetical protein
VGTAAAIVANLLITSVVFRPPGAIWRVEKQFISKFAMLLLAAITIMMVRKRIEVFIAAHAA